MADSEVWEGATRYWNAFHALDRSRNRDMGEPVPIREADMLAYAAAFGFAESGIDLEEFCDVIHALDQTTLLHHAKSRQATMGQGQGRVPGTG